MNKSRIFNTSEVIKLTGVKPNHLEMWIKYGVFKPSVEGSGRRMYSLLDVLILNIIYRCYKIGCKREVLQKIVSIFKSLKDENLLKNGDIDYYSPCISNIIISERDIKTSSTLYAEIDFDTDITISIDTSNILENLIEKIETMDA